MNPDSEEEHSDYSEPSFSPHYKAVRATSKKSVNLRIKDGKVNVGSKYSAPNQVTFG